MSTVDFDAVCAELEAVRGELRALIAALESSNRKQKVVVGWVVKVLDGDGWKYERANASSQFADDIKEAARFSTQAAADDAAADWRRFDWEARTVAITRTVKP